MYHKLHKGIFLGLLLVLCMSVAVAADVTEDTASDVAVPSENYQADSSNYEVEQEVDSTIDNQLPSRSIYPTNYHPVSQSDAGSLTVNNSTLYDFDGPYYNINYNFDNLDTVVFTSTRNNAVFYNSTFTLNGENIRVSNLKFNNHNTSGNPIDITANNSEIINNEFTVFKNVEEETFAIKTTDSTDILVENNYVNVTGVPQMMGWETGEGKVKLSGIVFDKVNTSVINNNRIFIQNCTEAYPFGYSTMEAITVRGHSNDTNVTANTIMVKGSEYIYAISLSEFDNNIHVERNYINLNGSNYVCGIQLASVTNSIVDYNTINGVCESVSGSGASYEAFAYGITVLTTGWMPPASEATGNVVDSNQISLHSTVAYAIELSNADYTQVTNNNGTVTGNVVMGLGIYNSTTVYIVGNRFLVYGNTRDLYENITEAVYPVTTGIKMNNMSSDIYVSDNIINVTDTNNTVDTYCVIVDPDCEWVEVCYNTLTAINTVTRTGDNATYSYTDDDFVVNIHDNN